jgi:hypothetical protein
MSGHSRENLPLTPDMGGHARTPETPLVAGLSALFRGI